VDEQTYRRRLRDVLDAHGSELDRRLRAIAAAATGPQAERVTGLAVEVFLDQDGEGAFDVWARFEGADSFALNRPVDGVRHLFGVVHGERGLEPDVPPLGAGFDGGAVVLDVVTSWVRAAWESAPAPAGLPFEVGLVDGC